MTIQSAGIVAIIALLTAGGAASQEPTFRATTKMIELSVVATSGKNQQVSDLKKEDFTVLEDGKPVQISYFATTEMLKAAAPPKLPAGIYTNRPELLPHAPRTVTAIVLDYLNSPWEDQVAAREQVIRVLRSIDKNDVVAIYSLGQNLRVMHDYTSDRASLEERLLKAPGYIRKTKDEGAIVRAAGDRWEAAFGENRLQVGLANSAVQLRTRMSLTMNSLSLIARHLAGVPGRRNLVWISSGFAWTSMPVNQGTASEVTISGRKMVVNAPGAAAGGGAEASLFMDQMDRTVRAISDAGVTVYGLDSRGLMVPMVEAGDVGELQNELVTMMALSKARNDFSEDSRASLNEVSVRTGGYATLRANDLTGAFQEILEDARHAYQIAYYTPNDKADGKFRKIEVKVNRPGVKLRYRPGYTADDPGRQQAQLKPDLNEASSSPVGQTGILLTAQARPGEGGDLNLALQIEPKQLSFRKEKDEWSAKVDVVFVPLSASGMSEMQHSVIPVRLTEANYQVVMAKGLVYRKVLKRQSDAKGVRVVVRDGASGAIGTLDIPYPVN